MKKIHNDSKKTTSLKPTQYQQQSLKSVSKPVSKKLEKTSSLSTTFTPRLDLRKIFIIKSKEYFEEPFIEGSILNFIEKSNEKLPDKHVVLLELFLYVDSLLPLLKNDLETKIILNQIHRKAPMITEKLESEKINESFKEFTRELRKLLHIVTKKIVGHLTHSPEHNYSNRKISKMFPSRIELLLFD